LDPSGEVGPTTLDRSFMIALRGEHWRSEEGDEEVKR
jgi:hypothetical protein